MLVEEVSLNYAQIIFSLLSCHAQRKVDNRLINYNFFTGLFGEHHIDIFNSLRMLLDLQEKRRCTHFSLQDDDDLLESS
jgi:hypothetical protein